MYMYKNDVADLTNYQIDVILENVVPFMHVVNSTEVYTVNDGINNSMPVYLGNFTAEYISDVAWPVKPYVKVTSPYPPGSLERGSKAFQLGDNARFGVYEYPQFESVMSFMLIMR